MRITAIALVALVFVALFAGYWAATSGRGTSAPPTPLFTYEQTGRFTYLANLANNTLYNTTTLTPGNGTLFTSITRWINVSFTYELTVNRTVDASMIMTMTAIIQTSAWSKEIGSATASTTISGGNTGRLTSTFDLEVSNITSLVEMIEKQTGYNPSSYVVVLTPTVSGEIGALGNATGTTFSAPLSFNFTAAQIQPSRLVTSQSFAFTPPGAPDGSSGHGPGAIPYALLAAALVGIGVLGYLEYRSYSGARTPDLEALTRPFQEALVDTPTPPPSEGRVWVPTWTDLVKVADTLGCPILRVRGTAPAPNDRPTFYVLSGTQAYVYRHGAAIPPGRIAGASPARLPPPPSPSRSPAPLRAAPPLRPPTVPTPPVARSWSLESFVRSAELVDRAIRSLPPTTGQVDESERLLLRAIDLARRGQLDAAWVALEGVRSKVGPWNRSSARSGRIGPVAPARP